MGKQVRVNLTVDSFGVPQPYQSEHGQYVRYSDYATLEAENAKLRAELAAFKSAVDHVTADGKTTRSFSASEGWSMVHCDRLTDLHVAEERLSELERRAVDGWKLVPVEPTPEMVSAAEEAYMPFGDMDIALRMAILSAPSAPATAQGGKTVHDLLAVIHRDGGHYEHEHGTGKALADAMEVVNKERVEADDWRHAAPSAPKADPVKVQLLEALESLILHANPALFSQGQLEQSKRAIAAARKGEGE